MELIQINKDVKVGQEVIQTVNARELHGFLKNGKMFAHWIKERIGKYGFVEGVDYCTAYLPNQAKTPGRPAKEYHVSIGMAKELAMVERNEQGKQARLYFIECERKLQEIAPPSSLPSYPDALRQLAATLERNAAQAVQIEQQTALIETQKPAVEFVQEYVEKDGTMNFRSLAKLIGATEADFRNFLSDNKYRYREGTKWTHYKKWGDGLGNAGYFTLKVGVSPSSGLAYQQSYFTPKGVEFFTRKWKERNSKPPVLTRKAGPMRELPAGV
jgi:anti-repressor protein